VWPWALAALVLTAACWTMPALEQVENDPGNLTMIVRTAEHRGPSLGADVGWHAIVRSIGMRPWWLYVPASEWQRKYEVLEKPSSLASGSTLAILAALVVVMLLGAGVRRWDVVAGALIGLGLCAAIGLEAASNPSAKLLAETLGYTMWWGSELGLWVWLVLAWALWLALGGALRAGMRLLLRAVRARAGAATGGWPARARVAGVGLASLAGVAVVAAIGGAVAATAKPDSHIYDYRPIAQIATGIERLIPPGANIDFGLGPLNMTTQPMEPAIRFLLVRHRDRPMAEGSFPRLGSYYELYDRPVQWIVHLNDGVRRWPGCKLVARVHYVSPWGHETLSAWVGRAPRTPTTPARRPTAASRRASRS